MKTAKNLLAAAALGVGLLSASTANATLTSVDGGLLVYDSVKNITWLANANLAPTNTFGVSGIRVVSGGAGLQAGLMSWYTAQNWIAAMNAADYLGHTDWRLPTSNACAGINPHCTGSEMGELFYTELGGNALGLSAVQNANSNWFHNFQSSGYWSGMTALGYPDFAMVFGMDNGFQGMYGKRNSLMATAVFSGQFSVVAQASAAVPEPGTAWLFGLGLLGFAGVARRRNSFTV